jgi:hypothetical protein
MSFGDIAKHISGLWKHMSAEKKETFLGTDHPETVHPSTPVSVKSTTPTVSAPVKILSKKTTPIKHDNYDDMKNAELKKLCKERGILVKGMTKRSEFIEMMRKLDKESVVGEDSGGTFSQLLDEEENILLG